MQTNKENSSTPVTESRRWRYLAAFAKYVRKIVCGMLFALCGFLFLVIVLIRLQYVSAWNVLNVRDAITERLKAFHPDKIMNIDSFEGFLDFQWASAIISGNLIYLWVNIVIFKIFEILCYHWHVFISLFGSYSEVCLIWGLASIYEGYSYVIISAIPQTEYFILVSVLAYSNWLQISCERIAQFF